MIIHLIPFLNVPENQKPPDMTRVLIFQRMFHEELLVLSELLCSDIFFLPA